MGELVSASTDGADFELRGGARWFLVEPFDPQGALSLTASLGATLPPAARPQATFGASYDLPLRRRLLGRVSLELIGGANQRDLRATLSLVLPPSPPPVIERIVYLDRPVEEETTDQPPPQMVWVADPVCDWVPLDEAEAILAELNQEKPEEEEPEEEVVSVTVIELPEQPREAVVGEAPPSEPLAPLGVALAAAAVEEGGLPFWAPTPLEGLLLVIAHPGDRVQIDGRAVPVNADGVAMLRREEGAVAVELISGGQRQQLRAALAPGYAVWVRANDPQPSEVYFAYNSAAVSDETRGIINRVAQNAAEWSFVLQGGYSPEGTLEHNRKLAVERAREVSRLLLRAGISSDRIVFLEPPPPDPNEPVEQQRNCKIIPVPPGRGDEG